MSRVAAFIGGGVAVAFVGGIFVVPMVMSSGSLFPTAEDLKEGTVQVSTTCGSEVKIQQVTRNTPKVAGWSTTQVDNAAVIVKVGQDLKVPPRGWVIAVATAMQESKLVNLGHLGGKNDHDSQGLFQQRPSQGWGKVAQIRDPIHASTKFYKKLLTVDGWQTLPLTKAAQRVQISAYPNAYAKWENNAAGLVDKLTDGASKTPVDAPAVGKCAAKSDKATSGGWVNPVHAPVGSGFRTAERPTHHGVDLSTRRGVPIYAAADGTVIHMECDRTEKGYDCSHDGGSGKWPGGCGWYMDIRHAGGIITRYCHMLKRPLFDTGDKVKAGDQIGEVGSTGKSSGPHLHFEVHRGSRDSGSATDPVKFMKERGAPLGERNAGGAKDT
jgi:murein DD-endopeptidase MepM/ murein hydrolase activator NlpD